MPRIIAVGTSIPEFVATNEYVISLALDLSKKVYAGDIDELERGIRSFLDHAGAKRRYWRSGFSKPAEHIFDAWKNCVAKLEKDALERIAVLIYCGIDRGVAEPSHASLLAQKFGLSSVRTFDISDACMGWFTATQAARNFVTVEKPYCAIISAEFPLEMPGKVYPPSFTIKSAEDLLWKGAALTLGEAASVTVIDPLVPLQCIFKSNSSLADICCVPLIRPDRFVESARLLPQLADDCFVAHMPTMASAAYREAQGMLTAYIRDNGEPDIILPHTVSQTGPVHASRHVLKENTIQNCFEIFGNVATSSIPVGYDYFDCTAKDGVHIAAWLSAAGMSHCIVRLL